MNTQTMLTAAGFCVKTPEAEKQRELYAAAEPYKVKRITANGKTFYAFKDEKSGAALVGDESNYQVFTRLAVQQRIAQQECQAAQMRRDAALGWYGAYGYNHYGVSPVSYGFAR